MDAAPPAIDHARAGEVTSRPSSTRSNRTVRELAANGSVVARLTVDRMHISLGQGAWVAMDAVGNVATEPAHRRRGYARQLMLATIEAMRAGGAAISMLYGIDDFYDRLGWVRAGDEQWLQLPVDGHDFDCSTASGATPAGWHDRAATADDLPAMRALYAEWARDAVGAAMRGNDDVAWAVVHAPNAARVLVDASGAVAAYAVSAGSLHVAQERASMFPGDTVLGELHARDDQSAAAALEMARTWAEALRPARADGAMRYVHVGCGPQSLLERAANAFEHRVDRHVRPRGGSMVLLLDSGRWHDSWGGEPRDWTSELVGATLLTAGQYLCVVDRY